MLTFLWLLSGAALVVALGAFARVRRLSKRLERLSESYWELRYEHGQLRSRIARLEPAPPVPGERDAAQPARADNQNQPRDQSGATAFVPLASLKRPNETTVAE